MDKEIQSLEEAKEEALIVAQKMAHTGLRFTNLNTQSAFMEQSKVWDSISQAATIETFIDLFDSLVDGNLTDGGTYWHIMTFMDKHRVEISIDNFADAKAQAAKISRLLKGRSTTPYFAYCKDEILEESLTWDRMANAKSKKEFIDILDKDVELIHIEEAWSDLLFDYIGAIRYKPIATATPYRVVFSAPFDYQVPDEDSDHMAVVSRSEIDNSSSVVSYLSNEEYERQLSLPDALWSCPYTNKQACFDDIWFERYHRGQEHEPSETYEVSHTSNFEVYRRDLLIDFLKELRKNFYLNTTFSEVELVDKYLAGEFRINESN